MKKPTKREAQAARALPGYAARRAIRTAEAGVRRAESRVLEAARSMRGKARNSRPLYGTITDLHVADQMLRNAKRRAKQFEGKP
jgi:hypothetical protein